MKISRIPHRRVSLVLVVFGTVCDNCLCSSNFYFVLSYVVRCIYSLCHTSSVSLSRTVCNLCEKSVRSSLLQIDVNMHGEASWSASFCLSFRLHQPCLLVKKEMYWYQASQGVENISRTIEFLLKWFWWWPSCQWEREWVDDEYPKYNDTSQSYLLIERVSFGILKFLQIQSHFGSFSMLTS